MAISVTPKEYLESVKSHSPGFKADQGKNRLSLIFNNFASALSLVGEVGTMGAAKYTDNGWCHTYCILHMLLGMH